MGGHSNVIGELEFNDDGILGPLDNARALQRRAVGCGGAAPDDRGNKASASSQHR